jgi:hypothetical protein
MCAMPRVRVLAVRMTVLAARAFQWKRSELNSRLAGESVEGALESI